MKLNAQQMKGPPLLPWCLGVEKFSGLVQIGMRLMSQSQQAKGTSSSRPRRCSGVTEGLNECNICNLFDPLHLLQKG